MKAAHPYEMPAFDVINYMRWETKSAWQDRASRKACAVKCDTQKIRSATGAKVAGIVGRKTDSQKSGSLCRLVRQTDNERNC